MKKSTYNYSYKKEHNYKAIKILIVIFIACIIGLVICSFFTPINFNTIGNNSNKGIMGFIQSCASCIFGAVI